MTAEFHLPQPNIPPLTEDQVQSIIETFLLHEVSAEVPLADATIEFACNACDFSVTMNSSDSDTEEHEMARKAALEHNIRTALGDGRAEFPVQEREELWVGLDWMLWGAGMGDVFREPLADKMISALSREDIDYAERLMRQFDRSRGGPYYRNLFTEFKEENLRFATRLQQIRAAHSLTIGEDGETYCRTCCTTDPTGALERVPFPCDTWLLTAEDGGRTVYKERNEAKDEE